eukprot:jgi/Antlo1/2009/322
MGLDTVHDKDLEKILKHYCGTPFFRDNPYYISLWERYYVLCNKNPSILFFMKHKRISKNYHFLYIELSRHFELKGLKDVSAWILQRAIEAGVYRSEVLVSELIRLGRPPGALAMDEIARELNPQDFVLWGKKWCSKESTSKCERKSLEDGKHKCATNVLKEIGSSEGLSFSASGGASSAQNVHIAAQCKLGLNEKKCSGFKMQDFSIAHEMSYERHNESESSAVCLGRANSKCNEERIHIGAEFTIENRVFYVKSRISKHLLFAIEMPDSASEHQATEVMHYTIQIDGNGMCRAHFDKYIPDRIVSLGQVLLYKHYELGLLSSAVCLMPELNIFFFLKALEIAMYYAKKGVFFADLSVDNFFIDDDMSLVLCTFSQEEKGCVWKYRVFSELGIEHANTYMNMEIETALSDLNAKVHIIDTEDMLLRLRIAIFEKNIAEHNNKHKLYFRANA